MDNIAALLFSLIFSFSDLTFFKDNEGAVPSHFRGVYTDFLTSLPQDQAAFDQAKVDIPATFFALDVLKEKASQENKEKISAFEKKLVQNIFAPLKEEGFFDEDASRPLGLKIKDHTKVEELTSGLVQEILKVKYRKYANLVPAIKNEYESDFYPTFMRLQKMFGNFLGEDWSLPKVSTVHAIRTEIFKFEAIADDQAPAHTLTADELNFLKSNISGDLPERLKKKLDEMSEATEIEAMSNVEGSTVMETALMSHLTQAFVDDDKDEVSAAALLVTLLAIDGAALSNNQKGLWKSIARKICDVFFVKEGQVVREKNNTISQLKVLTEEGLETSLSFLAFAIAERFEPLVQKNQAEIDTEFNAFINHFYRSLFRFFGMDLSDYELPDTIISIYAFLKSVSEQAFNEAVPNNLTQDEITFLSNNLNDENDPLGTLRGFVSNFDETTEFIFTPSLIVEETKVDIDNFLDFMRGFVPRGDSNLHHIMAAMASVRAAIPEADLTDENKKHLRSIGQKIIKVFLKDYLIFGVNDTGLYLRGVVDDLNFWHIAWSGLSMISGATAVKYRTAATAQAGLDQETREDFDLFFNQLYGSFFKSLSENPQIAGAAGPYGDLINRYTGTLNAPTYSALLQFLLYRVIFPNAANSKIGSKNSFSKMLGGSLDLDNVAELAKLNFLSFTSLSELKKKREALDKEKAPEEYRLENSSFLYFFFDHFIKNYKDEDDKKDEKEKKEKKKSKSLVDFDIDTGGEGVIKLYALLPPLAIGQEVFKGDVGLVPNNTTPSGLAMQDRSPENIAKFKSRYKDFITSILDKRYSIFGPDQARREEMAADFPTALEVYEKDILSWFSLDDSFRLSEEEVEEIRGKLIYTSPTDAGKAMLDALGNFEVGFEDKTELLKGALAGKAAMTVSQEDVAMTNGVKAYIDKYARTFELKGGLLPLIQDIRKNEEIIPALGISVRQFYKDRSMSWVTAGIPVSENNNTPDVESAINRCVSKIGETPLKGKDGKVVKDKDDNDVTLGRIFNSKQDYHSLSTVVRTQREKGGASVRQKVFCGAIFSRERE